MQVHMAHQVLQAPQAMQMQPAQSMYIVQGQMPGNALSSVYGQSQGFAHASPAQQAQYYAGLQAQQLGHVVPMSAPIYASQAQWTGPGITGVRFATVPVQHSAVAMQQAYTMAPGMQTAHGHMYIPQQATASQPQFASAPMAPISAQQPAMLQTGPATSAVPGYKPFNAHSLQAGMVKTYDGLYTTADPHAHGMMVMIDRKGSQAAAAAPTHASGLDAPVRRKPRTRRARRATPVHKLLACLSRLGLSHGVPFADLRGVHPRKSGGGVLCDSKSPLKLQSHPPQRIVPDRIRAEPVRRLLPAIKPEGLGPCVTGTSFMLPVGSVSREADVTLSPTSPSAEATQERAPRSLPVPLVLVLPTERVPAAVVVEDGEWAGASVQLPGSSCDSMTRPTAQQLNQTEAAANGGFGRETATAVAAVNVARGVAKPWDDVQPLLALGTKAAEVTDSQEALLKSSVLMKAPAPKGTYTVPQSAASALGQCEVPAGLADLAMAARMLALNQPKPPAKPAPAAPKPTLPFRPSMPGMHSAGVSKAKGLRKMPRDNAAVPSQCASENRGTGRRKAAEPSRAT